ncbi:hypothetical protein DENSPDRAFT_710427 [Dentipellis sp. KUC8613]|nr:hypothetical protein DENSPDRAFT_710427 [Dentipellis sp. KUC8613]
MRALWLPMAHDRFESHYLFFAMQACGIQRDPCSLSPYPWTAANQIATGRQLLYLGRLQATDRRHPRVHGFASPSVGVACIRASSRPQSRTSLVKALRPTRRVWCLWGRARCVRCVDSDAGRLRCSLIPRIRTTDRSGAPLLDVRLSFSGQISIPKAVLPAPYCRRSTT